MKHSRLKQFTSDFTPTEQTCSNKQLKQIRPLLTSTSRFKFSVHSSQVTDGYRLDGVHTALVSAFTKTQVGGSMGVDSGVSGPKHGMREEPSDGVDSHDICPDRATQVVANQQVKLHYLSVLSKTESSHGCDCSQFCFTTPYPTRHQLVMELTSMGPRLEDAEFCIYDFSIAPFNYSSMGPLSTADYLNMS